MKSRGQVTIGLEKLHDSTVISANLWGATIQRSSAEGCDFVLTHPNLAVVVLTAATSIGLCALKRRRCASLLKVTAYFPQTQVPLSPSLLAPGALPD